MAEIADLYEASFPESERKPASFIQEVARREDYELLQMTCGPNLWGMAVVHARPTGTFRLLEYIAVTPETRGLGLGGAFFSWIAERALSPLLLEVESERAGSEGSVDRKRRLAFYRKHGCRTLQPLEYIMPPVGAGSPPPMNLLIASWPGKEVGRHLVTGWLRDIYRHVYDRSPDDSNIREMTEGLPDMISLR
ncbi:N-acetyltransferase [Alteriqipengyuania sp. 357]